MRLLLLFLFISSTYAITCDYLKFMYSDLTCCANNNIDTCLRQIPLCSDTGLSTGDICTDSNNKTVIVGGAATNYTLPVATQSTLGGVMVDGSTITVAADGTISSTAYTLPQANETTLGGVKVDGSTITVTNDGTITSVNNYTLPAATETTLGGICVDNTSIVVDSYGKISISPTFTSSSTSSSTAAIAVDNSTIKQYDNGTIYAVGGTSATSTAVVTRDGQVLEELVGVCDGGAVGSYTWPSVTAVQTTTTTFATLTGSEIAYTPPAGATEVVYMLSIAASTTATSGVYHVRLMIDGVESGASPTIGAAEVRQYGTLETIRFVIDAWTGSKTLKLEIRHHSTGATFQMNIHKRTLTPTGSTDSTNELIKPILNIRAIGVQLNYVNFEPTPTALLSAQTFEVTQAECASTALVNSIKAQFATMFPSKSYGTLGNAVYTSTNLPRGCQMFIETYQTDYTRVLFNPATSDPDNALGSGYSAVTFSHRICKYANGDFVLLDSTSARCKTVHFTLPDNLNTLAGVLQTDSAKLGIGVTPEASFHIGLSENVDVNVSRFECDGSGAIIEQTSGELTTVMSQSDCAALTSYQSTVPTVSAVKKYDGYCSTSTSNSPYNYNVLVQNEGSHAGGNKHLTFAECKTYGLTTSGYSWATDSGNDAGTFSGTVNPPGCHSYTSGIHVNVVYYNTNLQSTTGCDNTQKCLLKLNVKDISSGTPPNDVSTAECKALATFLSRNYGAGSFSADPSGCFKEAGSAGKVWYNTASTSHNCGTSSYICLAKDTTYDNPGTTEQARIDACRDACTNRSIPLFSGSWDFRSASFWVEPTGGECHCGAEPAGTCATTASDFTDLYELNNPPKGCFRDSSGNHYHNNPSDDNYGVCSTNYKCLRNDKGCLVQDTNNETKPLSLIVEQSAWFKNEVVISSDERIKMNIEKIDNATAILRQIEPRRYEYVDKKKWNGTTVGFIAQQVKEVMPEAVKVEKGFVPNLLQRLSCTFRRNNTLQMHCPQLDSGRVRLFVTDDNGESMLDVDVEEGVMEVDRTFTQVYAFGYEVDDFHTLEKSKLFALNFAATQELDRRISALESIINGT